MRTMIINLDRRPDRMAMMARQLEAQALPFERIPATAAEQIDPALVPGRCLSPAEIACHLSHRKTWKRLAESGDDHALILEDDVVLSGQLSDAIGSPGWIPRDALMVKIECHFQNVVLSRSETAGPGAFRLAQLRSLHYGSAGYIIARRFAERLLRAPVEKFRSVDVFLFAPCRFVHSGGVIYQMRPALCAQVNHFLEKSDNLAGRFASDLQSTRAVFNKRAYQVALNDKICREANRICSKVINRFAAVRDRISGGRIVAFEKTVAGIAPHDVAVLCDEATGGPRTTAGGAMSVDADAQTESAAEPLIAELP